MIQGAEHRNYEIVDTAKLEGLLSAVVSKEEFPILIEKNQIY